MTTLNPGKPRTLTAAFFAADGKPARVDGDPVWNVSDASVAVLEDTSSAFVKKIRAVGPGSCEVTCAADADLGEGVRPLTLTAAFTVPEVEASTGSLTVGEEEVPPAPEPEPVPEPVPEPTPEPVVADVAPEPVASDDPAHDGPAFPEGPAAAEGARPTSPGDPAPPNPERPTE